MRAYAILISKNNDYELLFSQTLIEIIKKHGGGVVLEGYNMVEYIACIVFKTKARRDICANELINLKVNLTIRNDAIIPDGYL